MDEISQGVQIVLTGIALVGGSYVFTLIGSSLINKISSEKIKSQEDLERIVNEESANLGINKRIGNIGFIDFPAAMSVKFDDENYGLYFGTNARTRKDVRHELYHIHKHLDQRGKNSFLKIVKYLLIEEPQAVLYGTFGIKS